MGVGGDRDREGVGQNLKRGGGGGGWGGGREYRGAS